MNYHEALKNIHSLRNLDSSASGVKNSHSNEKAKVQGITRANRIRASPELRCVDFKGSDRVSDKKIKVLDTYKFKSKLSDIH